MEHEAGPRGSPHVLRAPVGVALAADPFADTANTESCGVSFLLWHFGHSACPRAGTMPSCCIMPRASQLNRWSRIFPFVMRLVVIPSAVIVLSPELSPSDRPCEYLMISSG